jgi:hypothetical protein
MTDGTIPGHGVLVDLEIDFAAADARPLLPKMTSTNQAGC